MDRAEMLRELSNIFHGFADTLLAMADPTAEFDVEQPDAPTPVEETTNKRKQPDPEPEPKLPTLEEVRAVLAELSRAGHTAEVKHLLKKHGSTKLSGIAPSEYPMLLAEAEVL